MLNSTLILVILMLGITGAAVIWRGLPGKYRKKLREYFGTAGKRVGKMPRGKNLGKVLAIVFGLSSVLLSIFVIGGDHAREVYAEFWHYIALGIGLLVIATVVSPWTQWVGGIVGLFGIGLLAVFAFALLGWLDSSNGESEASIIRKANLSSTPATAAIARKYRGKCPGSVSEVILYGGVRQWAPIKVPQVCQFWFTTNHPSNNTRHHCVRLITAYSTRAGWTVCPRQRTPIQYSDWIQVLPHAKKGVAVRFRWILCPKVVPKAECVSAMMAGLH